MKQIIKQVVENPFGNGYATLHSEESEITFRKEKFSNIHLFYETDDEPKERFTTTELDDINISQVYNLYRVKYGIPFVDEIHCIREKYGLSASKISMILGFGPNQYRLYESGDIPSETNGKILASIKKPLTFLTYVENARNQFDNPSEYQKIYNKVEQVAKNEPPHVIDSLIFDGYQRSEINGFAVQSLRRLKNIILYFIDKCGSCYATKMNKLLFFADFLSYKNYGQSISGLAYKVIQYGPVPCRWDRIYSLIDGIYQNPVLFTSGQEGQLISSEEKADMENFSEEEIMILNTIINKFKDKIAGDISTESHKEDAWLNNVSSHSFIDFKYAFQLKAV